MFICVFSNAQQTSPGSSTDKNAGNWYQKMAWLDGLKLKPHSSVDQVEFAKQYQLHPDRWKAAFRFLKEADLAGIKPGRYPVMGDSVYVTVSESASKEFDQTKWEGHKHYADIHYMFRGKEKIGKAPIKNSKIIIPYDDGRDIAFYDTNGKIYTAGQGEFFMFFANLDAHRPGIKVEGVTNEKKIVVKIKTDD